MDADGNIYFLRVILYLREVVSSVVRIRWVPEPTATYGVGTIDYAG
jgi:hypothetical protein